ncbi:flotillin family protein [Hassallia byssoidea VB512170]|uniref:Flotillin family protein n=1 Tax=Hassallia byssoidea VB512170 TaxID=1304833 RepID=A0A846HD98_9CYAN|nr:SPFH domain-containing protein [Hassalia byssoidea]NEU74401.1 flotillin family protein [Hassalia byssoidea VB512170]
MTTKLFISKLVKSSVALGSIAIISQSIDSLNPRLTTASAENPPHLSSHSTTISLQTNLTKPIDQPVTTAGISLGWVGGIFLGLGVIGLSAIALKGIVVIGNNEVGIVIKKYNLNPFFPKLPAGQLIALKGEAGSQAKILTPGMHWGYFPQMYIIRKQAVINIYPEEIGLVVAKDGANMPSGQNFGKFVECNNFQDADAFITNGGQKGQQLAILTAGTYQINTELFEISKKLVINITQGQIGLVVAKDGANMPPEQLLGKVVDCSNFQDSCKFITNGGQKGRQLAILTTGTYQINTDLFTVITAANATRYNMNSKDLQVYTVEAGKIGIVTTYDGISIKPDEIAGSPVPGHGNFQNGQKFIDVGGCKGLQQEILPPGSWNLNPWFVKVEQVELTDVPVGAVGVVISHVGKPSENKAGVVEPGYKGVWNTSLRPGKHVINTKVMNVEIVPTQPITLDWSNKIKLPTNYDANLHPLQVRSKDGFCFDIEVTQVIGIAEENAPTMIYRVGNTIGGSASNSIKALIVKVLQPAVSNYFCNSAQNSEALDFLDKRSDQQRQAKDYIKSALNDFAVEALDTLIGEIDLPEQLEKILTDRKIAQEQRKTIEAERETEKERQNLAYEKAVTNKQADRVKAQEDVKIAELNAIAAKYGIEVEVERVQLLREVEIVVLEKTIDIIGREGWLDIEKLKELVKLKLPEVWVSNSHDGGSGLIDAIMPQVLRTLKTTTINSNNSLSTTHQANQRLDSSTSTALPQG